jgi:hypothetical protein
MLREAELFLRRHLRSASASSPGGSNGRTPCPLLALREAPVNALCHRDYSIHDDAVSVAVRYFRSSLPGQPVSQVSRPRAGRRVKLLQPDRRALECIVVAEARAQRTASRLGLGFQLLRQRFRQTRGAPVPCSERAARAEPAHGRRVVRLVPRQRQHQLRRACGQGPCHRPDAAMVHQGAHKGSSSWKGGKATWCTARGNGVRRCWKSSAECLMPVSSVKAIGGARGRQKSTRSAGSLS